MNKLSVIILTDRVDDRFEAALASALFADEVLVVLTRGAKLDRPTTTPIKVVNMPGEIESFSDARNQSLEFAAGDWIFMLDSDEVLPSNASQVLKSVMQQKGTTSGVISRQDIFHGKSLNWGEAGKLPLLRLAQKKALRFERPVHEVAVVPGVQKKLPLTLQHFAHQSINQFWTAISKYSRQEAIYRYSEGQRFSMWQLCLYPPAKFMLNYFLKLGFLDGWRGLLYATMMSCHSLMVRIYLYEAIYQ